MNKFIKLIIGFILISLWLINSCSKSDSVRVNSTNSATTINKSDKCSACDSLKEFIKTDPLFRNYQNYLDSLFCNSDNSACLFNTQSFSNLISNSYIFFDMGFQISASYAVKHTYSLNYGGNDFTYLFYSHNASDTPYQCPINIWLNFDENLPNNKPIDGAVSEISQYYYPLSQNYVMNEPPTFANARQKVDTVSFWRYKTTITDKGVNTDYRKWYYVILSPDRESAKLIVKYYSLDQANKLVKTIDNITLKRWHKP